MGSSPSKTTSSSSCCSASTSPPVTKLMNSKVSSPSPTTVPKSFSFPMPSVHHPPANKGDSDHLVSLTSTTYGSLHITDLNVDSVIQTLPHIKKTPEPDESHDSLSPDSVINTWELMNGLEDDYLDTCDNGNDPVTADQDVGVNVSALELDDSYEFVGIEEDDEDWIPLPLKSKQPLWKHLAEESFLSDLDPNIISSYKRALSSKQIGKDTRPTSLPEPVRLSLVSSQALEEQEKPRLSEVEDDKNKVILYFTSLRGIRKTFEDCCYVRTVLRGYQVAVEERDISMDSRYRKELQIALSEEKPVCLPQVFIRGVHIGGMEEIKKLNDGGELGEMLKGFPVCESVGACECCGDARFVPCTSCGGSTKVFEEQEDGFKRCNGCNENGLVRCTKCCL
ncbi:unnamed protein product [Eruca vesicaria subsp. sativa]|uniref:Glutaredoxin domain-containing protein n=1 Tax=Eruca vesicaria subsp. sativa TaxID=29727 RepID=A0ABC8LXJ2_ERUVS|nr:unnamed protein product [Eruca vesicaria subsp. sativa]